MIFLGDVFLEKTYNVNIQLKDFVFNLEYPLSTKGKPAQNKINLGSDMPNILETFGKFPLAVNLANNHIMDYGEEAFIETLDYLKLNKIKYFGAGNKNNNYNNPCIIEENERKIALLGYSCPSTHAEFGNEDENGSALLDENFVINDVISVKDKVDFVVVQLHWGDEEVVYPKATDVEKARMFIRAGADLIIGHHAHVIQSVEKYKDKFIFYGIGNFIFPDFDVPSYHDGIKFKMRSKKIQRMANKQSVVVNLDNNLDVSFKSAIFKNDIVKYERILIPTWIPESQNVYNLYYFYIKRVGTIKRFLKKPKFPKRQQMIIFLGLNKLKVNSIKDKY